MCDAGFLGGGGVNRNTWIDDHVIGLKHLEVFDAANTPVEVDYARRRGGVRRKERTKVADCGSTLLFSATSKLAEAVLLCCKHPTHIRRGSCRLN